ncbi:hypothetical protein P0F65_21255 [Sphingomonas sp. I4]
MLAARLRRDAQMPVRRLVVESGHLVARDEGMGRGGDDRTDI